METLSTLATLLPLALTSGINLYATIFLVGLSIRLGWVQNLPAGLEILTWWPITLIAGLLVVIEFLADSIPLVEEIWDFIHTFIRPLGAILLSIAVLGDAEPKVVIIAALMAGSVALISHSSEATTHLVLDALAPTPVENIFLGFGKNIVIGFLVFLTFKYPVVASIIALVILGLMLIFVPQLVKWVWFLVSSLWARLKSLVCKVIRHEIKPDTLPSAHRALLRHQVPRIVSRCKAQGIRKAKGRAGFVSIVGRGLVFTYNAWFASHAWCISLKQIVAIYLHHRTLTDVLEVHYCDDKHEERQAQFVFMKDRASLVEQLVTRLAPSS